MSDVGGAEALIRKFPDRAPRIRRLQAEDATFRAICEDYAEGLKALAYWQAADQSCRQRADEYRRMVKELEDEALSVLTASEGKSEEVTMSKLSIALLGLLTLVWGCTQHSKAWDDAWAQCQAEAIEQMETAGVAHDQRSEWQENYIRDCMQKRGFDV